MQHEPKLSENLGFRIWHDSTAKIPFLAWQWVLSHATFSVDRGRGTMKVFLSSSRIVTNCGGEVKPCC